MVPEDLQAGAQQNYDRLSRWYDWFSSSERRISKIGMTLLGVQKGGKILEIGFGTGHALLDLAEAVGPSGSVYGIDLSPGMYKVALQRIQRSRMKARIFAQVGDSTRLPYPDHQFQAVFMSFTLELFTTQLIPVVLKECRRVLQPGGKIGIVSLSKKETRAVGVYEWFHYHFPKLVDCKPIHVRSLLEENGYNILQYKEVSLWGLPVEAVIANLT
jgi:ubiquinone/menaquinone biosynthesis C-methylase UbiE